jgi:hypothetical protein
VLPMLTWPSPPMTTLLLRRTESMVVPSNCSKIGIRCLTRRHCDIWAAGNKYKKINDIVIPAKAGIDFTDYSERTPGFARPIIATSVEWIPVALWAVLTAMTCSLFLAPRARMRGVVDARQVLEIEVGINLCRGDIGVAEQLLHRAQVRARFEQVRGEGMAQHVR